MDQDWAPETVRILTPVVRVIPVSARLVDLFHVSVSISRVEMSENFLQ